MPPHEEGVLQAAQQPVKHPLNDFDKYRQPDIADIKGRFVFDIVPPGQAQRVAGKKKVDWNLLLINKAMLGVPTFHLGTDYAGEVGVRFAEGTWCDDQWPRCADQAMPSIAEKFDKDSDIVVQGK
jgi:hypothetical protein